MHDFREHLGEKYFSLALLAVIIGLGFILRFIYLGKMNLFVDEAYYWDWARHLSFGYYSHPPMVAWMIAVGRLFFGDSEFAVRIPFVVVGTGTIYASYLLGKVIFDKKVGLLMAFLIAISPSYIFTSRLATPDQPVVFFWILAMIFFWKAYKCDRILYWLLFGFSLGLGFLSKYQMLFLPFSLVVFLVLKKKGRGLMFNPGFYAGLVISLILFMPNIIWNAQHQWITFVFQSVFGLERSFALGVTTHTIVMNFLVFLGERIGDQDVLLKLSFYLSFLIFYWYGIRKRREEFVFLFISYILITLFFSIFNGKGHWSFPGAICVYLMLSAVIVSVIRTRKVVIVALILTVVFIFGQIFEVWMGIEVLSFGKDVSGELALNRVYLMVVMDSRSWKNSIDEIANRMKYRPKETVLVAQYYTIASQLAFYLPDHPRVYSPNGQYLIWGPLENSSGNAVVVASNERFLKGEEGQIINIKTGNRSLFAVRTGIEDLRLDWKLKVQGP